MDANNGVMKFQAYPAERNKILLRIMNLDDRFDQSPRAPLKSSFLDVKNFAR